MADVPLKCRCGTVQGVAKNISPNSGTRVVCYCDDCQAFAKYLGNEAEILDDYGGTDIFQLTPAQVKITSGAEQLRSMRLSSNGLIRWYTHCCRTPIGNTISAAVPFLGMVHCFIDDKGNDETLGPVRFYLAGQFAQGSSEIQQLHKGVPMGLWVRNLPRLLLAKLQGKNKPSPFFDADGEPVSAPEIYTSTS